MSVNQTTKHQSEAPGAATTGFGISYAITSILSALLVVLKGKQRSRPQLDDCDGPVTIG